MGCSWWIYLCSGLVDCHTVPSFPRYSFDNVIGDPVSYAAEICEMVASLPVSCHHLYREAIIDPAAIFAMLFGSEIFEDYIGELAMASMASLDILGEDEQIDARKLQEKMRVCPC